MMRTRKAEALPVRRSAVCDHSWMIFLQDSGGESETQAGVLPGKIAVTGHGVERPESIPAEKPSEAGPRRIP